VHVERQRAIENVLIKNAAIDSDDEWADFDVVEQNRMEDPGKQYLRSKEGDPRMKLAKIMSYRNWENLNSRMNININDRMSTLEPFVNASKPMPSYGSSSVNLKPVRSAPSSMNTVESVRISHMPTKESVRLAHSDAV